MTKVVLVAVRDIVRVVVQILLIIENKAVEECCAYGID